MIIVIVSFQFFGEYGTRLRFITNYMNFRIRFRKRVQATKEYILRLVFHSNRPDRLDTRYQLFPTILCRSATLRPGTSKQHLSFNFTSCPRPVKFFFRRNLASRIMHGAPSAGGHASLEEQDPVITAREAAKDIAFGSVRFSKFSLAVLKDCPTDTPIPRLVDCWNGCRNI